MNDNVVEMPTKKPEDNLDEYVFICGECSCKSFLVTLKGNIECSNCDTLYSDLEGGIKLKLAHLVPVDLDLDSVPEKVEKDGVDVHRFPDESFARRHVMQEINGYHTDGDLCLVMGYRIDGKGRSWMDIRTEEHREWVLEKIDQLRNWVAKELDLSAEGGYRTIPKKEEDNGDVS